MLIHTPDYPPTKTEALITDNNRCHDNHHFVSTQVSEEVSAAYCLEIMQKSVCQFEKRITRSMRKNPYTKSTKTHHPTTARVGMGRENRWETAMYTLTLRAQL